MTHDYDFEDAREKLRRDEFQRFVVEATRKYYPHIPKHDRFKIAAAALEMVDTWEDWGEDMRPFDERE